MLGLAVEPAVFHVLYLVDALWRAHRQNFADPSRLAQATVFELVSAELIVLAEFQTAEREAAAFEELDRADGAAATDLIAFAGRRVRLFLDLDCSRRGLRRFRKCALERGHTVRLVST